MAMLVEITSDREMLSLLNNGDDRLAISRKMTGRPSEQFIQLCIDALSTRHLVELRLNEISIMRYYDDIIVFEAEGDLCECNRCVRPLPSFWSLMPKDEILDPLLDRLGLDTIPILVERV